MSLQRNLILALKLAEEKVRVSILKASFGYSPSQLKLPISYLIKIWSFKSYHMYRTRVISTPGYYFFRGFLLRVLFESGYYSRACTIRKLSHFKLEKGQIHVKIAILQSK